MGSFLAFPHLDLGYEAPLVKRCLFLDIDLAQPVKGPLFLLVNLCVVRRR